MNKELANQKMRDYYSDDSWGIEHALQVLGYAEQIYAGEKLNDPFVQEVITLAGLFHDVGIPEAKKKHGTGAAPYQEIEGEPIARRLLTELNIRPDILERVCYIVRWHHTLEKVDGLAFQILWEADALVNIPNRKVKPSLDELLEHHFKTKTGRQLITSLMEKTSE